MTHPRPPRTRECARFFTVGLAEPGSDLLTARVDRLRAAFASLLKAHPVRVDAMVVLPDHLHAVWVLPEADADFAGRWRILKGQFTRLSDEASPWQPRYAEHPIASADEHRARIEYCWHDPVRHGLARRPVDWPYSSFRRDLRRQLVSADWAARPTAVLLDSKRPGRNFRAGPIGTSSGDAQAPLI